MNHPATAFAGSVKGGRAIQWESLAVSYDLNALTAQYPNVSLIAGGLTTRYRTLIPVNVLAGPVTMLRVRGTIFTTFLGSVLAAVGGQAKVAIPMSIQLVPVRDGAIIDDAVLSTRNAADLESNRILWRGCAWPNHANTNGIVIDVDRVYPDKIDVDIKVKRRWDRASWALVMATIYNSIDEAVMQQAIELRGLFQTPDGV